MNDYIEVRNGVYYVSGTKISLDSVVYAFHQGASPEAIPGDFEGLTRAKVYGAIAFCLDHQAELDQYLAKRQEKWRELERSGTAPSSELLAKLERARHST